MKSLAAEQNPGESYEDTLTGQSQFPFEGDISIKVLANRDTSAE